MVQSRKRMNRKQKGGDYKLYTDEQQKIYDNAYAKKKQEKQSERASCGNSWEEDKGMCNDRIDREIVDYARDEVQKVIKQEYEAKKAKEAAESGEEKQSEGGKRRTRKAKKSKKQRKTNGGKKTAKKGKKSYKKKSTRRRH